MIEILLVWMLWWVEMLTKKVELRVQEDYHKVNFALGSDTLHLDLDHDEIHNPTHFG